MKIFYLFLVLLSACSPTSSGGWKIARDPYWYPNQFPGREIEVTAFSDQLVREIAHLEGFNIGLYPSSWSFIQTELLEGRVDGILTNLPLTPEVQALYDFSDNYLPTGPVLVVKKGNAIQGLADLEGREVGIVRGTPDILIIAQVVDVMVTHYPTYGEALLALSRDQVNGVLIPALIAEPFVADIYAEQLAIVTPPLNEMGLRMAVAKGKSGKLLTRFDKGLEKLKQSSKYGTLLQHWHLSSKEPTTKSG